MINLIGFVKFGPFKFGFKFYCVFDFGFAGKFKFNESRINKQILKHFKIWILTVRDQI